MADLNQTPLMDIRVVALYPTHITQLASRRGVRFRSRRQAKCTLVPCSIESLDGRSIATPEHAIPAGTPAPKYRLQFETTRLPPDDRRKVCVVLSAEPTDSKTDPEQALLSPIFDDGNRMIFEFRRAYILTVARRGDLETRLVAIDPLRGIVGTKTVHRFDTRLLALSARCVEHLAGDIDLFPMRDKAYVTGNSRIPEGEANLSFDANRRQPSKSQDQVITKP